MIGSAGDRLKALDAIASGDTSRRAANFFDAGGVMTQWREYPHAPAPGAVLIKSTAIGEGAGRSGRDRREAEPVSRDRHPDSGRRARLCQCLPSLPDSACHGWSGLDRLSRLHLVRIPLGPVSPRRRALRRRTRKGCEPDANPGHRKRRRDLHRRRGRPGGASAMTELQGAGVSRGNLSRSAVLRSASREGLPSRRGGRNARKAGETTSDFCRRKR